VSATALLVVDMQNTFCSPEGHRRALGYEHVADELVSRIRLLVDAARAARVPVIYTRYVLKADYSDAGLLVERFPALRADNALVRDTWGTEIVAGLEPEAGEHVVDKARHSAFFGTELEAILHSLGIETLIVCGVTTNVCVEGTVRDAFARDLRVLVASDGTAAATDELHEFGLRNIAFAFGDVMTVAELVASFSGGRSLQVRGAV
jgi:ureidoacrylate peracid hydrolase